MIESVLLAVTRVCTFQGDAQLSTATGFFYERDERLFLVTARHVLLDEPNAHRPERIAIDLHTDPADIARITQLSIPLYRGETRAWREGADSAGLVDVAVLQLERKALPATLAMQAF